MTLGSVCCDIVTGVLHYTIVVPIKIFLLILSLLETSACLWILLICMPVILVSPQLYRKITDFVVEEFCRFSVQLFGITTQVKLKISGDDLTGEKFVSFMHKFKQSVKKGAFRKSIKLVIRSSMKGHSLYYSVKAKQSISEVLFLQMFLCFIKFISSRIKWENDDGRMVN